MVVLSQIFEEIKQNMQTRRVMFLKRHILSSVQCKQEDQFIDDFPRESYDSPAGFPSHLSSWRASAVNVNRASMGQNKLRQEKSRAVGVYRAGP